MESNDLNVKIVAFFSLGLILSGKKRIDLYGFANGL